MQSKKRRFSSWTFKTSTGRVKSIVVADWQSSEESSRDRWGDWTGRPPVVELPVSQLHEFEDQAILANKIADHLNSILQAQEKAIEGEALFQKIIL